MPNQDNRILLTEQYTRTPLKLIESKGNIEGACTNAVIATLFGVLSDFGHMTRNERWYTAELWEKVLGSAMFRELVETKTMFGEPDHPMDIENRLEVHIPYVSHIIRDPKINYQNKTVEGYIDILDTPYGRIIKTLVDYGCTLGVSSRGAGELVTRGDQSYVDPESYMFITWDIVARPSNQEARVNEIDTVHLEPGSSSKTVSELLELQVDKMICENDTRSLEVTKSLLENTRIPNKSRLLEKIQKNSSSSRRGSLKGSREFVDEAYNKLLSSRREINQLESKCNGIERKLAEAQDTILGLRSQRDNLQSMVTHYMERISELTGNTGACKCGVPDSSVSAKDGKLDSSIAKLTEMVGRISEAVSSLKEDAETTDDYYDEAIQLGKELEASRTLCNEVSNEKREMTERYSDLIESYLSIRCQSFGLNESLVRNEFRGKLHRYDPQDVDRILRKMYKESSELSSSTLAQNETGVAQSPKGSVVLNESVGTAEDDDMAGLIGIISNVKSNAVIQLDNRG